MIYLFYFSVCQDGIKPMWEDDRNKLGGRWLMTLNKQQRHNDLDRYWMETVVGVFPSSMRLSTEGLASRRRAALPFTKAL